MIHLHEKNQGRKRLNALIAKSTMKVPGAVGEVGEHVFADGALGKKHKELTTLAVAVVQNCFNWIEHRVEEILHLGVSDAEIAGTSTSARSWAAPSP